eukprot:403338394
MKENKQIIVIDSTEITLTRSAFYSFSQIKYGCQDPENQEIQRTILINSTEYNEAILNQVFKYEASSLTLEFYFDDSSKIGLHNITMICDDNFNEPISFTILVHALENYAPVSKNALENQWAFVNSETVEFIYSNISDVFYDQEYETLDFELRLEGDIGLETITDINYYIDQFTDKMHIFVDPQDSAKIFNLLLKAQDGVYNTNTMPFSIEIKACHESCATCSNDSDSDCTSCVDGLVLYQGTCVSECGYSTYLDSETSICEDCPTECEACSGPSASTQCSYRGDLTDMTCVKITNAKYQNCLDFIKNFDMTDTSIYIPPIDEIQSKSFSCLNMEYCDLSDRSGIDWSCNWERKLLLTCDVNAQEQVIIRVLTNSLPNHCMQPTNMFPIENVIDFEVAFSLSSSQLSKKAMIAQNIVDYYMCSMDWINDSATLESKYSYNKIQGDLGGIIGISITGVPIYSGTSELFYDAFYPQSYTANHNELDSIEVDACLGSTQLTLFYHYYSISPCVFKNPLFTPITHAQTCEDLLECKKDPLKYAIANIATSQRVLKYVGIARDGHMIVGPFKSQGALWQPCDVDACNGAMVNGHYVYVSTLFHPYTVGCWGPATGKSSVAQSCSSNVQICLSQAISGVQIGVIFIFLSIISFLM